MEREYDPAIVFDDVQVLGGDAAPWARAASYTPARQDPSTLIAHRLRAKRLHHPPTVLGLNYDLTPHTFSLPGSDYEILGGAAAELPLFRRLLNHFRTSVPPPRAVRVDGEDNYKSFRDLRRAPYVASLAERLKALEDAFEDHISDGHGGHIQEALDHVVGCAQVGGERVGLDLPPRARSRAVAWQDGPEVLVTILLLSPVGEKLYATTGAQVADHFDEVADAAEDAGVPLDELTPDASASAAAESALVGLATVAPVLACLGGSYRGVLDSGRAERAAAMSLLQHYQRGSRRAKHELQALWRAGGQDLLRDAGETLEREQQEKAGA